MALVILLFERIKNCQEVERKLNSSYRANQKEAKEISRKRQYRLGKARRKKADLKRKSIKF